LRFIIEFEQGWMMAKHGSAKRVPEPACLVFTNPLVADGLVLFESTVLVVIAHHRQLTSQLPESGGILLGYRRGLHLHITHATKPGPQDRATRVSFVRKDPGHQAQALRMWKESGCTTDYLGEWHTHPEAIPNPSSTDHRAWAEISGASVAQHVFVIAGTSDVIWAGCADSEQISRLIPFSA
jgi:integrative and conjugative element protein (TIGR02256 family)